MSLLLVPRIKSLQRLFREPNNMEVTEGQFGPPSNARFHPKTQANWGFLAQLPLVTLKHSLKKLRPMKLFPAFFVLTGEGNDKLNVAEIEHDYDNYEKPAPRGRPAKSFAGADC
jgi:hypothetical protein